MTQNQNQAMGVKGKEKHNPKPEKLRSRGCSSRNNKRIRKIKQRVRSRSGYNKDKLYMDSGASSSMLFNREMVDIKELKRP